MNATNVPRFVMDDPITLRERIFELQQRRGGVKKQSEAIDGPVDGAKTGRAEHESKAHYGATK